MNESVECLGGESSGCFAESIEDALDVADRMAEETPKGIHMKNTATLFLNRMQKWTIEQRRQ